MTTARRDRAERWSPRKRPPRPALRVAPRPPRPEPYDRAEILARWAGCAYCDGPAEELDHVLPLARGGRDVAANLVAACRDCNASKYTHTLACWATHGGAVPCVCGT
ncbi:HNH endonuclease [Streptomyces phage Attoomi]|uniref:HNH endonuclease n=1 Tax=Streptomyces phage Attoomi TaxID=2059881 RepID=A0A2H5BLF5_9CAUD|nr:HNH endonuclease [Streptomyces phage Attoomi]AUG87169.1 HNH endonuclease [Streptomyces phage Attoomi]